MNADGENLRLCLNSLLKLVNNVSCVDYGNEEKSPSSLLSAPWSLWDDKVPVQKEISSNI